ncbi:2Fe-2S iron-sulfur cluster-binding protein [Solimonas marina]|uniref:2Fe-2S iron-sulfur cluster binding domain-containing protein n=1 Tax=Solimonas marina TaxID=2714601 RepID=A0A969W7W9_9GAMM|nr:2Fe-2S iron-sulfur cluster-binding protein [Solimonas marina]NKF22047.1 2Fe-2S iron-sulfur cluster binding domain-containing protein [Solimonas marina]
MTHQVYLSDRPQRFTVEDDETILAAGLRHGLALPFGCQSGGCASCRVRLSAGSIDYAVEPPSLSPAERDAGYILMCLARPTSDLTIELHQPVQIDNMRPRQLPVRAQAKTWLAHDVLGLTLKLPRGDDFQYLPGQYIDLLIGDGRRRSFSIANKPNGETLELHIRVTPNGRFANWAANEMPDRAILRLEGPLGAFYLRDESTRPLIMVAGGTGAAPIHAMLNELLARGSGRPAHLFWGARSLRDLYLDASLQEWTARHPEFRYTPVLSEPDAEWAGARGFVHEAVLAAYPDLSQHEVYLSGPPAMVRAGKDAALGAGLDADHLYYDSFDYAFQTWPTLG